MYKINAVVAIRIFTIWLSLFTVIFIVIPHHKTEKQSIEIAKQYIADMTTSSNSDFEFYEISNMYLNSNEKTFYTIEEDRGIINRLMKSIADYWNPNLKYREVSFKVTSNSSTFYLYLNVDAYTGFIWSNEGIIWENLWI